MFKAFTDTMTDIHLEQFIYQLADQQIEGYNGGMWQLGQTVGTMDFVGLPETESGTVRVRGQNYCDVTTDPLTAGAALSVIAYNLLGWKLYEVDPSGETTRMLFTLSEDLKYAVLDSDWDDQRKSDFLSIID